MAQAHPLVREWRGAKLEADLLEAVTASVQTIADDDEAQRVAEVMHALALPAASYRGRLIDAGGVRCIAHIDFTDPSGDFPFVKVRCASVPPGSIADWGPISGGIARAFGEFRPRAAPILPPVASAVAGAGLAHRHASSCRARPEHGRAARCRPASTASSCSAPPTSISTRATRLPTSRCSTRGPSCRARLASRRRETLAQCLEQGLLCEVFVDGAWSGLIAARADMLAGVRGLQMVEIVLTQSARGHGLGPAVHQGFARSVAEADPAAVLMGTISPKNAPSLQAALRAGRMEIGRVPLGGPVGRAKARPQILPILQCCGASARVYRRLRQPRILP